MAKPLSLSRISFFIRQKRTPSSSHSRTLLSFFLYPRPATCDPILSLKFLSTTQTPYPLQYDMIISRPAQNELAHTTRRRPNLHRAKPTDNSTPESDSDSDPSKDLRPELSFEDWVDQKLTQNDANKANRDEILKMDKAKRKYYNKRRKRMYGTDSEDENRSDKDGFVELKPEVIEFRTLHKREEELYFHDTFAYPWDKDKHYKMVYQLEKKYFPDQCLDKAFLEPGQSSLGSESELGKKKKMGNVEKSGVNRREKVGGEKGEEDKGLIFFDDQKGVNDGKELGLGKVGSATISEKKVEDFFKCLKKIPNKDLQISDVTAPFLASRSTGLPPKWDSPGGTVLLVNKPKGWTSFTVCGKLRRLVKVKKVGHAGTLDPMATGLLIVCVGKATKVVDRYQGMLKGYSGVFRLGEATSTWDADSPVIQREPWEHIRDEDIKKAAASFVGEIWQVPPMFSAIKVGGEKMYDKARRGESIELSPRRISIFEFHIERSLEDRQNLIFRVTCSKGTYIRSLCADLGKALGSCAHLTALRRDSIGEYSANDAYEFQELEEEITKTYL